MAEPKDFNKIIIADTLSELASEKMDDYLAHALCIGGSAEFDFNGKHFTFGSHDLLTSSISMRCFTVKAQSHLNSPR